LKTEQAIFQAAVNQTPDLHFQSDVSKNVSVACCYRVMQGEFRQSKLQRISLV